VALGAAPLVASCSFGTSNFDAQTNQFYTPAEGVSDRSSAVDVLNAVVVSAEDGTGRFVAGLANNSNTADDSLDSVKGSGASSDVTEASSTPVPLPAGGFVQLADAGVEPVVLQGDQIVAGHFIEVTISFQTADTVTVKVPVVTNEDDWSGVTLPSAGASS
jgi:hypothetical protein